MKMQENNTISKDFKELQRKALMELQQIEKIKEIKRRIYENNTHVYKSIRLYYIDLLRFKKLKMLYKQKKKDMLETIIQYLYTELQEKGEQYMQIKILIEKIQLEVENLQCLNKDINDDGLDNKNTIYQNYIQSFTKAKDSILYDLEMLLEILEKSHINTSNHKIKHSIKTSKQLISKNTESQDTPNLFDLH